MQTWIALLRSVHIGGKTPLSFSDLQRDMRSLDFENVRILHQSGNIVFESSTRSISAMAKKITRRLEARHVLKPYVHLLSPAVLESAIEGNPFKDSAAPETAYCFFLSQGTVEPNLRAIEVAKSSTEEFSLADRLFYLRAPEGLEGSKLAANVEKFLGVTAVCRDIPILESLLKMSTASRPAASS